MPRSTPLGFVHRPESVGSFARLRNRNYQSVLVHHSVSIAKFRRIVHFASDACQRLHPHPSHHSGVETGAHSNDNSPVEALDLLIGKAEFRQIDGRRIELDTTAQRIEHGIGLLKYLLEHEVVVFALGRGHCFVGHARGSLLNGRAVYTGVLHLLPCNRRHLANREIGNIANVRQQCSNVAGEQHLLVTVADNDPARVAELKGDNLVRFLAREHNNCICALDALGCGARRLFQGISFPHIRFYQMRDALRVRLRVE